MKKNIGAKLQKNNIIKSEMKLNKIKNKSMLNI